MTTLSYLIYVPLQILAIPGAIVGVLLTAYKQILVSKRLEVSQTAIEIINGRWTLHVFGLRKDDATAALMSVLPNTSKLGLWLVRGITVGTGTDRWAFVTLPKNSECRR